MHNFIWKIKSHNQKDINQISQLFSVPKSIATIMFLKSINNKKIARSFFYNNSNNLHNPLLMKDMDKAIDRIIIAKKTSELILIIGDYDTDGTAATSVLYLYFKSLNIDVAYYIPNRQSEGYGVSSKAIDSAATAIH